MGFGLSSRFFSISLSLLVGRKGAKAGHVGPHRDEREAKRGCDPIQGWSPSSSAEPGLQARIRRSAKLSTIMPSFVRGGGPRRQVQIFATALKPEPGAAHCHLGAVRKRRWSLSSSLDYSGASFVVVAARSEAPAFSVRRAARRWESLRSQPGATARSRVCA